MCDQSQPPIQPPIQPPTGSSVATMDQSVPKFVGLFKVADNEKPPLTAFDSDSQLLSRAERNLCNFFKCSYNWEQIDGQTKKKCYATRQTTLSFEHHLKEVHFEQPLVCIYCFDAKGRLNDAQPLKKYTNQRYLIKHMVKRHPFRRFQCNKCLYRALTEDHVAIHQRLHHESLYKIAVNGSPVVSDSSDTGCQIFFCQAIQQAILHCYPPLNFFYLKYKSTRVNTDANNKCYYQCVYCVFVHQNQTKVAEHSVDNHPDYPILYYRPGVQIISPTQQELSNQFIKVDGITVRPKYEPQDNCVSSTQKNIEPVTRKVDSRSAKKRPLEESPETVGNATAKKSKTETAKNETQTSTVVQSTSTLSTAELKSRICLFCYELFGDEESGTSHMRAHFGVDDYDSITRVYDWIKKFMENQNKFVRYEDTDPSDPSYDYYYCPLCVRMAATINRKPRAFKTFGDVRHHIWEHCLWHSVECTKCWTHISNCDANILRHISDNHQSVLASKKYYFLLNDSPSVEFTEEQLELLKKNIITIQKNDIIEKRIKTILEEAKNDNYHLRRQRQYIYDDNMPTKININDCKVTFRATDRLSDTDFQRYHKELLEWENSKTAKEGQTEDQTHNDSEVKEKKSKEHKDKDQAKEVMPETKSKKKKKKKSIELIFSSDDSNPGLTDKEISNLNKELTPDIGQPSTSKNVAVRSESHPRQKKKTTNAESEETEINTSGNSSYFSTKSPETERNPRQESDLEAEEDAHRITCYHCSGRFQNKKQFREHHNREHKGLVQRMFAKETHPNK